MLRLGEGRAPEPAAVVVDGRTLQATPESGPRASYDGHTRKKGTKLHVLLPRRWIVERSFAWLTRFRPLARDYELLPETLAGLHYLAFACLLLSRAAKLFASA